MSIRSNIEEIKDRISTSAKKSGRHAEDIMLVCVTKTVPLSLIDQAVACGMCELGENRVQEFLEKQDKVAGDVNWHIIGQLQSNKVKYILGKVKLIHSLSSVSTAAQIQKIAQQRGIFADCLIQMNIAREEQKSGVLEEDMMEFVDKLSSLDRIRIRGLMTMAPLTAAPDEARPVFAGLRGWFDRLKENQTDNFKMEYLSMGMSGDYAEAIEEGSNIVRIGTAIFRES